MNPAKYATVKRDGFTVPLIRIPSDATVGECDLCGNWKSIFELEFNGKQMLCKKCREENKP